MRQAFFTNVSLQLATIISGLVFFPFYFDLMGHEKYYVITVFITVQAWFAILDFGMSPAIARTAALYNRKEKLQTHLVKLILICLSVILALSITFSMISYIVKINYETKIPFEVTKQLFFSAVCTLALRWALNFGKFVLNGLDRQALANFILIVLEFGKHTLTLLFLHHVDNKLETYFTTLLFFTLLQTAVVFVILYSTLNFDQASHKNDSEVLYDHFKLTLTLGVISVLGVLAGQVDRALLMSLLTFEELSYFAVILMYLNGLNAMQAPIYQTLVPKITQHSGEHFTSENIMIYSKFALLMAFCTSFIIFFITCYSQYFFLWWSGNATLTAWVSENILFFGIIALAQNIGAFSFFLQSALGKLQYHVYGSILNLLLQIVIFIMLSVEYDFDILILVLAVYRCSWTLLWLVFIHKKLETGLNASWFLPLLLSILANYAIVYGLDYVFVDYSVSIILTLLIYVPTILCLGVRHVR